MLERIDYVSVLRPDGQLITADTARWIMAIVSILEERFPGTQDDILRWLEESAAQIKPIPKDIALRLGIEAAAQRETEQNGA